MQLAVRLIDLEASCNDLIQLDDLQDGCAHWFSGTIVGNYCNIHKLLSRIAQIGCVRTIPISCGICGLYLRSKKNLKEHKDKLHRITNERMRKLTSDVSLVQGVAPISW